MTDTTTEERTIDDGHDAGDDNALQRAMLDGLEKQHAEQLARGEDAQAAVTKEDIDALRAHMAHDAHHDPFDQTPDDLSVL
jgi:hypothetical protein